MKWIATGALVLLLCGPALAADAVLSGFPRDAASLEAINAEQLKIVHEAVSSCWKLPGRPQGAYAKACVVNSTESIIQAMQDPELLAFHRALPMHVRYDDNRPASYWQHMVQT